MLLLKFKLIDCIRKAIQDVAALCENQYPPKGLMEYPEVVLLVNLIDIARADEEVFTAVRAVCPIVTETSKQVEISLNDHSLITIIFSPQEINIDLAWKTS